MDVLRDGLGGGGGRSRHWPGEELKTASLDAMVPVARWAGTRTDHRCQPRCTVRSQLV